MAQFTGRFEKETAGGITKIYAEYGNKFVESVVGSGKVGADVDGVMWVVSQPRKDKPTKNGAVLTWTQHQELDPEYGGTYPVVDSIDDVQPLPIFSENFPIDADAAEAWVEANVTNLATAKEALVKLARQLAIITSELQR